MRGALSIVTVLSAIATLSSALPQPSPVPRADAAAAAGAKPKYSIVPLEPSDDDPQSSHHGTGGGDGNGGNSSESNAVTEKPVTQTVSKTGPPVTITNPAPTTISTIFTGGTQNVTVTVTVTAEVPLTSTSTTPSTSAPTTTITTQGNSIVTTPTSPTLPATTATSTTSIVSIQASLPDTTHSVPLETPRAPVSSITWSLSHSNHTTPSLASRTETTKTASYTAVLSGYMNGTEPSSMVSVPTRSDTVSVLTTISTVLTPSLPSTSTKTFEDGTWHMTYPPWNGTVTQRFRRL
ncbi:hypothetical protein ED733_000536 [Metarhizium rileyi]|uniref:Uncharacterized protein n=1 Tax=Metarhizium rileyi (strain RCEF 4871) TaxID=1649241 RepID=A0A5C6GN10_METRR|nr:hypothetical protein ED733_000536 [Metarhizium rileyi]